ncbi:MAG: hypothetical protein Crog4KO_03260 [Crocinitomicaceae bacterium]
MRFATLLIVLLIFGNSFAQNFTPFNFDSPTRFREVVNPSNDDYFFFAYDSTHNGASIQLKQYLKKSNYFDFSNNPNCVSWGGPPHPLADTTWLGQKIEYDTANQILLLQNDSSEVLSFDFSINLGDSSVFYSNGAFKYFIRFDGVGNELIIDSTDSVKKFSIWKYDLSDNLLPSVLNGFELKLSDNYGLISLFDVTNFPGMEVPLQLMGHANPSIGYYQMTYDELYPWQAGDTLEYRGIHPITGSFGQHYTSSHIVLVIDNRVETADSVFIYSTTENQVDEIPGTAPVYPPFYNITVPSLLAFKKGEPIILQPQDSYTTAATMITFDSVLMCGNRGQLFIDESWNLYCDSCNCWVPYDGNGTDALRKKYTAGLGVTYQRIQRYGNWSDFRTAELIYSNVNGIQCGTFVPLSVPSQTLDAQSSELVQIVDVLGRVVEQEKEGELYIYQYSDGTSEKKVFVE